MRALLFLLLLVGSLASQAQTLNPKARLAVAETKLRATLRQLSDTTKQPRYIKNGDTTWHTVKLTDWTSGFWPGQLWMMYEHTHNPYWMQQARRWQASLEPNKDVRWTHDLGFMMYDSWGRGYHLTKDPAMRQVLLTTASNLALLFNPKTGTMRSWTWRKDMYHPTIIDNMMNLELLFWAAREASDKRYYDMAKKHAETTLKNHIRPDFTTYHVVVYDTATGGVSKRKTDQGKADESMWARGQAWGIYGFTMCYRETKDPRFLETAKRLADVFMSRLPADKVPYWDFDAPQNEQEPRDASAAAIAASGLIELGTLAQTPNDRLTYLGHGRTLLKALSKPPYATDNTPVPALLLHSTGSKPHNSEIDVAINYADYYYMEGLMRLNAISAKPPMPKPGKQVVKRGKKK